MSANTDNLEIVKQLFRALSEADKNAFLQSLAKKDQVSEKLNLARELKQCPYCKSAHFVKNGKVQGRQRFLCMDCKKTFTATNNTILFGTAKSLEVWQKYIHCLVEKYSLRKTAEICNISLPTAFAWRHNILNTLQNMMNETTLDGVVEADETFFQISFKGHHKNFNLPRIAKKRGTAAIMRGLSKEQVCIPCSVNLNGKSIAKVANLGKPSVASLQSVLSEKIAKNSVFVTDSLRAYSKISNEMDLNHIRIPRNKHAGAFNIQVINSYHSRLKAMIIYGFKGVATK